ncbi:head GIN domain-containing protein [Hyphococcus sp.]|uniref:head GIN domain-containing protein n=1 Tax=Hyphococcus sp. TaxID=2038636 RepID=UPI0035C66849
MMKKLILSGAAVMLAAGGAAFADDDETVTRTLDLGGFDAITVAGVYELDVRVGSDFSVELSGPAYEMDRVDASVKNGALVLDQRKRMRGEKNRNHRDGVEAVITLPSLTALNISGVVDGHVSDVDADSFSIKISGVGDLEVDGECGALDADLSGVGDLDAGGLECGAVDVKVSGVGSAIVFASEEVEARVSGMGDIDVYGSPQKVSKNKSMFADITVH